MDNKTLSDFMPKVSSDGEITYGEKSSSQSVTLTNDHIIKVLTDIKDPEMDMNIYDLGLIYDVKVDDDNNVDVKMTLTTPNCPVAESLPMEVENTVKEVKDVKKVNLELVWDPPWDKSMITEAGKLELNL